jgi:Protein of unknown function (DUF669)
MGDDFFFDPETQEGSSFELIPPGDHEAEIIEAKLGQPKSGDGHKLTLTWKICQGDYEGCQVWETLCFQHSNAQTEDIARKKLKDICTALGINEQVTDPEVFKFKPALVRIGIESDKYGQFESQNRIKRVRGLADAEPPPLGAPTEPKSTKTVASSPSKPAAKPANTGPGPAPWKKSAA